MSERPALPPALRDAILQAAGDQPCVAVGGTVRDLLLGRPSADLDLAVVGEEAAVARRLARALDGAAVPLDIERGIHRVALRKPVAGYHHIDMARLRAESIAADLALRDFTINAIAVSLNDGSIIDPLGGQADLLAGRLRLAGPDAVRADPLRALRAVRFAAELGFTIDTSAAEIIKRDAALLAGVAGERQRDELLRVFETPVAGAMMRLADGLGVLDAVLPELVPAKGCTQPKEHYYDVFDHLIETVRVLDVALAPAPPDDEPSAWRYETLWGGMPEVEAVRARFDERSGEGRSWRAVLKLVALLHDVSKPETKARQANGRVRFFGHAELGAEKAVRVFERLHLTAKETAFAALLIREHLRPGQLSNGKQLPTKRALYRFFRDLGEHVPDLLLLNLADHAAARGPLLSPEAWAGHAAYIHWMLHQRTADEELVRPARLLTGHDLMAELGLPPGPHLGRMLEAIREAQAVGRIRTREAGLRMARRLAASEQIEPARTGGQRASSG